MIKVSIAQTDAILGNKENNAQIICFPELATTGYS